MANPGTGRDARTVLGSRSRKADWAYGRPERRNRVSKLITGGGKACDKGYRHGGQRLWDNNLKDGDPFTLMVVHVVGSQLRLNKFLATKPGLSLLRTGIKRAHPTTMLFPSDSISSHLSVFCIIASASLLLAQSTPAGITPLSSVKRQVFTSIDGDGWYSALPAANMIPVNELAGSGLPADCQAVVDFETDPSATTPAVSTTFKMQFDDCPTKEVVICMAPE